MERAARAAKELEKSKYATQALDLSKKQEETKQQEQMVKIKEYELSIEQMKVESKRVEAQEKRKMIEIEAEQAKRKAEYQDQLSRRRFVYISNLVFNVSMVFTCLDMRISWFKTRETKTRF